MDQASPHFLFIVSEIPLQQEQCLLFSNFDDDVITISTYLNLWYYALLYFSVSHLRVRNGTRSLGKWLQSD
jgi:hypothetical protein